MQRKWQSEIRVSERLSEIEGRCRRVTREKCRRFTRVKYRRVTREKCWRVTREEYRRVAREKCRRVTRVEYRRVAREKCRRVPTEGGRRVPREGCRRVGRELYHSSKGFLGFERRRSRVFFARRILLLQRMNSQLLVFWRLKWYLDTLTNYTYTT